MSNHPGVVRTTFSGLKEIFSGWITYGLPVVAISMPFLLVFMLSGNETQIYAPFAVISVGFYLALEGISGNTTTVGEVTDSRLVQAIMGAAAILYYNTVIFLAVLFGLSVSMAGYPAIAVAVAALYPVYDAKMAEIGAPISVAGAMVTSMAIGAKLGEYVEEYLEIEWGIQVLRRIARLSESETAFFDYLIEFIQGEDRTIRRKRGHV